MNYASFSLNGAWEMFYQEQTYTSQEAPVLVNSSERVDCLVEKAVPGYWEDMTEEFLMMPFFGKLKVNPSYGVQRYPIRAVVPDMALPNIMGNFFYRRTVVFEEVADSTAIYFDGVQNRASVWINGCFIGHHEGYSTSFELEIPQGVLTVGENTIILSVSNHKLCGYDNRAVSGLTSRAANEYTGGITGNVEFRVYKNPIRDISVFVSDKLDTASVKVERRGAVRFTWTVLDSGRAVKKGEAQGDFSFDTDGMEFWSPEFPKLYTLKISCDGFETERKFGIRRLIVNGVKFKLNGTPYFLRGICEHCYFPETVHPNHDKTYYRSIIRKIKELGFNFIRFHTYIPEEEYMEAADELGVLLHVESPNYTSLEEWQEIVRFCRRHTSVVIYCCGNELSIDSEYEKYLEACADFVHNGTDALFSPLSALRKAEYMFFDGDEGVVSAPFQHSPSMFERLGKFCDMYSSYANGKLSYFSLDADPKELDDWSRVYNKPRVSHEICIDGTYTDLSLKDRYKGTRIGKTEMFSSLEDCLEEKGILKNAPLYFKNSSEWQRRIRKHCFEAARLCDKLAGFDFLGPIDTHWHTFGYDVGMMNEFYELKPGETVRNVLMYNSPTVVLTDLDKKYNFTSGERLSCRIYVSHYGKEDLKNAHLCVRLMTDGKVIRREEATVEQVANGAVSRLCSFNCSLPAVDKPCEMKLYITLDGGDVFAENEWEIYVFPAVADTDYGRIAVSDGIDIDSLIGLLADGEDVLLTGKLPFETLPTGFRIALAGRTAGNLATVINDHPALDGLVHNGFCSWQFYPMMTGGSAVCFESGSVPFDPIIEVASTHKYPIRQAALFELRVLKGRLLVCGFRLDSDDPGAVWLKSRLVSYMQSDSFAPRNAVDGGSLRTLAQSSIKKAEANKNLAFNPNDKATKGE